MKRKRVQANKHLAYLAYRLGCVPYLLQGGLDQAFRIEWDQSAPFFDWAAAEAVVAIEALQNGSCLSEATSAKRAVAARLGLLKRQRLSAPVEQGPTALDDDDPVTNEDSVLMDATRDSRWNHFATIVRAFWHHVPPPEGSFAQLGDDVANLITWPLTEAHSTSDIDEIFSLLARLQRDVCLLAAKQVLIVGLELSLAPRTRRHTASPVPYLSEAKDRVRQLHRMIIERLGPPDISSVVAPVWITATEAATISEAFGAKLLLSTLNKHATKQPPPFRSQSAHDNKRIVEVNSFVAWLLQQRGPGKDKEPSEGDKDIKMRIQEARQKKAASRTTDLR